MEFSAGTKLRDAAGNKYKILNEYREKWCLLCRNDDGNGAVERWVQRSTMEEMFKEGKLEIVK